ncbi:2-oxo-4-hydroxy-4-carboxy-5-ureidoimidazoline decarboxylase [Streptomyces sp. NPDC055078]
MSTGLERASVASERLGTGPERSGTGLERFNTADEATALATLLACCGSRRWAQRLADHRPYPDLDALLAAADEAGYDLTPADLREALAREPSAGPRQDAPQAAHTAFTAAHAAYESTFGHPFVISLGPYPPHEHVDQILAGIRTRLTHEKDDERAVVAEELRGLARSRLARTIAGQQPETGAESGVTRASR